MLNFPFSAALFAGGQSRRMGRDKAVVEIGGEALWKRQLATLRQLNPTQLFICGRPDVEYVGAGCEVITDVVPNAGPIGGLVTALQHVSTEILLVLAVDLPAMQPWFLERLVLRALASRRSIIPQGPQGLEPLAAVYRIESRGVAEECLRAGEFRMRSLVAALEERGLAELYRAGEGELPLFRNVNTPEELAAANRSLNPTG